MSYPKRVFIEFSIQVLFIKIGTCINDGFYTVVGFNGCQPFFYPLTQLYIAYAISLFNIQYRRKVAAFQLNTPYKIFSLCFSAFCCKEKMRSEEHTSELQSPCNLV